MSSSEPTNKQLSHESLRNSTEFRRVLSQGSRHRAGGLVLASLPGADGSPRLGLVVAKSCGSAVTRNRIKRRLRAAADRVGLEPGREYVIIASAQVAEAPFDRLTGWLERALEDSADA